MIRIGCWQFSPGLWPSLAVLFFFPLLLSLGFWQLDRAEQKREIYQVFQQRQSAAPLDLNVEAGQRDNKDEMLWRNVRAKGEFVSGVQILLDNQVRHGEAGYYIFTPFKLPGEARFLLVNRGWLPAGSDRSVLPAIETPSGLVEIIGAAKPEPSTGILLGDSIAEKMQDTVFRVQQLKLGNIAALIEQPLLPYVVRLLPESDHGFVREWQIPGSGEEKHLGYAFQWFALAVTLLMIYLIVNLKKLSGKND